MILKKNLRAGVLLYALLIASIFVLVLQVYLYRVVSAERLHLKHIETNSAYFMAKLTQKKVKDTAGDLRFNVGTTHYSFENDILHITATTKSGEVFDYHFQSDLKK